MVYTFLVLGYIANMMEKLLFLSSENWCCCLGRRVAFRCPRSKAVHNSWLQIINISYVSSKTSIPDLYLCTNYLMCLLVFLKIDSGLKRYHGEKRMKQSRLTWQSNKWMWFLFLSFDQELLYCLKASYVLKVNECEIQTSIIRNSWGGINILVLYLFLYFN